MTIASKAFQDPNSYVSGLSPSWVSNTTLAVTAGQVRDSQNRFDITLIDAVIVDSSLSGVATGLDTGTIAASSTYYLYAVGSSLGVVKPTVVLSLSKLNPLLFGGYDCFRLIGVWSTNGSSQFIKGYVSGTGNLRQHYYDSLISVLSAGAATSLTSIVLTGVVPAIDNTPVLIQAQHTPAAAGGKASFAPAGSVATVLPGVSGDVAAVATIAQLKVLSKLVAGVPNIQYITGAGATTVWVAGFEYFI